MICCRLKIFGKVQGVFYRQSAKEEALRLGLSGTVRNCNDGTVEAIVEGEKAIVEEFIRWCRTGPKDALVERIDINESPLKNFSGFIITR